MFRPWLEIAGVLVERLLMTIDTKIQYKLPKRILNLKAMLDAPDLISRVFPQQFFISQTWEERWTRLNITVQGNISIHFNLSYQ